MQLLEFTIALSILAKLALSIPTNPGGPPDANIIPRHQPAGVNSDLLRRQLQGPQPVQCNNYEGPCFQNLCTPTFISPDSMRGICTAGPFRDCICDRCDRENPGRCDENECKGELRVSFPSGPESPGVGESVCTAGDFNKCPCRGGEVKTVSVEKRQASPTKPPPLPTVIPPPFLPVEQPPHCNGVEGRCNQNDCNAAFKNPFDTRGLCQGGQFAGCICQKCDGLGSCFENGCEGKVTLIGGDWECYAGEFHGCPCAPSRKRNAQDVRAIGILPLSDNGDVGPEQPAPSAEPRKRQDEDIRVIGVHYIPANGQSVPTPSATIKPTAAPTLDARSPQSIREHGVHYIPAAAEPVPELPTPFADPKKRQDVQVIGEDTIPAEYPTICNGYLDRCDLYDCNPHYAFPGAPAGSCQSGLYTRCHCFRCRTTAGKCNVDECNGNGINCVGGVFDGCPCRP